MKEFFFLVTKDCLIVDRWRCEGKLPGHPSQCELGPCPISMSPVPQTISGMEKLTRHQLLLTSYRTEGGGPKVPKVQHSQRCRETEQTWLGMSGDEEQPGGQDPGQAGRGNVVLDYKRGGF